MNSLFRVSAKNHAGMILMSILANRAKQDGDYVSLKEIASEMGLSQKFLEEIAASVKRAKLVEGKKGPNGGYRLAKKAEDISIHKILVALEGPIAKMGCDSSICPVAEKCTSKSLWGFLHKDLIESLNKTSLKQIAGNF